MTDRFEFTNIADLLAGLDYMSDSCGEAADSYRDAVPPKWGAAALWEEARVALIAATGKIQKANEAYEKRRLAASA